MIGHHAHLEETAMVIATALEKERMHLTIRIFLEKALDIISDPHVTFDTKLRAEKVAIHYMDVMKFINKN